MCASLNYNSIIVYGYFDGCNKKVLALFVQFRQNQLGLYIRHFVVIIEVGAIIILIGGIKMCTFIGIESLAANALIELLEKSGRREVSFDVLVQYGMEIVSFLQRETGEEAVLLMSRKYQLDMIENYSNFFVVTFDEAGRGTFQLKDDVDLEDLKFYFRWTMSLQLLKAFLSPEALGKLGVLK